MPPRTTRPRTPQDRKRPAAKAGTITYMGATYKVSSRVGIWPLMQFARAAEAGLDTGSSKGLAAIHAFLQDIIHPDDWNRFQEDMISKKMTDLDGLLDTVQQAVSEALERMNKTNGRATATVVKDEITAG